MRKESGILRKGKGGKEEGAQLQEGQYAPEGSIFKKQFLEQLIVSYFHFFCLPVV